MRQKPGPKRRRPAPCGSSPTWRPTHRASKPASSGAFSTTGRGRRHQKLVVELREAAPTISLPDGIYIVHAAFGLAAATRRVVIDGRTVNERVTLNAGGLKLVDKLGEATIPPQRLSISIYVPERGNSQAKLVLANARGGDTICLPEGAYHIVSTLLDTSQGSQGDNNATKSVATADLRVPAGKLIEATLRHRAATITFKLVNAAEARRGQHLLFRADAGRRRDPRIDRAFPSLMLAEGEMWRSPATTEKPIKTYLRCSRPRTPTWKSWPRGRRQPRPRPATRRLSCRSDSPRD